MSVVFCNAWFYSCVFEIAGETSLLGDNRVLPRKHVEISTSVRGAGICIAMPLIYITMTQVYITIKISYNSRVL